MAKSKRPSAVSSQKSAKKKATQPKHHVGSPKTKSLVKNGTHVSLPCVDQWRNIQTIGEKQSDVILLNSKPWDFSHLGPVLESLLKKYNDGSRLFVFGGQPHPYQDADEKPKFAPTFSVIRVPPPPPPPPAAGGGSPMTPPPFVALQNPQQGTDEILPMANFDLKWIPLKGLNIDGRVFALQRFGGMLTRRSEVRFEYATLFTMIPSKACPRKENGDIDIQSAMFTFTVNGEQVDEKYQKGFDTFTDFCKRHDLKEEEHKPKVKAAVKQGFGKARQKIESRLTDLRDLGYSESILENIRIVAKVYPQNNDLNCYLVRSSYCNQYYGAAADVF